MTELKITAEAVHRTVTAMTDAFTATGMQAEQAHKVAEHVTGLAAEHGLDGLLDAAGDLLAKRLEGLAQKVYDYLAETYPADTLGWVKRATWRFDDAVPLADVDMDRRPGGRDQAKVRGIAAAIDDGKRMDPVVLVDTGNPDGLQIADGYHRTLGLRHAGRTSTAAYVASGVGEHGPWDREMHDRKLNKIEEALLAAFGETFDLRKLVDKNPKATERLMHYWAEGEGAAKIRWGEKNDFYRCEAHLGKYVPHRELAGLCANLHHRALGVWPGQEHGGRKCCDPELVKFDPLEPRDDHGRWTVAGAVLEAFKPITAEQARGNSRPVSMEEFQQLAAEGQAKLDKLRADASPPTGLDAPGVWSQIKASSYTECQKSWGGATIDAHTGRAVESNANRYALSVKPSSLDPVSMREDAPREEFDAKMDEARNRFSDELTMQRAHLGVFHDDDNNRIDIDPVLVVDTLDDVETIGAATHAVGGAYNFADGNGYWPPHVAETEKAAKPPPRGHWQGPGQWRSWAEQVQREAHQE